jgi:hemerythrin-like metal-binding protein
MTVRWTPEVGTGHPDMDEEEHELFQAASLFSAAIKSSPRHGEVARALELFRACAGRHFAVEERLMLKANYPGRAAHAVAHDEFLRELAEWKRRLESNDQGAGVWLLLDVEFRLIMWLSDHTGTFDCDFGTFCAANGSA